jgi:hypothetical protein
MNLFHMLMIISHEIHVMETLATGNCIYLKQFAISQPFVLYILVWVQ